MTSRNRRAQMTRPRSTSSGGGSRASNTRSGRTRAPARKSVSAYLTPLLRRLREILSGPTGQQILAFLLMGVGALTLATVAGFNSGALVNAWARALVYLFGWGAYLIAALLIAMGLLWLRHLVHRPSVWRWRPILGLELALVALLTLTHTLMQNQSWALVEAGYGGGLLGWALWHFFYTYFGSLLTGLFMLFLAVLGFSLAFDLTINDLKALVQRVQRVWQTQQALREARSQSEEPQQIAHGVVVSPVPKRPRQTPAPPPLPESIMAKGTAAAAEPTPPKPTAPRAPDLPPLTLLHTSKLGGLSPSEIESKRRIIEETLAQFGVPAEVIEVRPGPTVTQFGVAPGYIARGADGEEQRKVRVSQIATLADDLALALAARSLRVEAPVPGRAVVGIEVPNEEIALVTLRQVLEREEYERCHKPLCFALGLDVAGSAVVADLSAMLHLLVAGTTGSGKSVFVKSLAASLVMRHTPDTLRLVTIDPKMVELSQFNGLPHLLGRAEFELERVLRVLRWVAYEMDQRYKRFAESLSRNLDDYNTKMARQGEPQLPRILVMIDELADLMMAAPEETERTLTRIAQMARATGIHLVVATQRPSTDVVTGLIKANFPARVSFATASGMDSRVILDTPGAESLLGRGDMLFLPPDAAAPRRLQGCFISDDEVEAIIRFWQKSHGATPAQPPWEQLAAAPALQAPLSDGEAEDSDLLDQAIALAQQSGQISTSSLQRRLRISYPRAARIMEQMEELGIVGPQESAGRPRRVILGGEDEL